MNSGTPAKKRDRLRGFFGKLGKEPSGPGAEVHARTAGNGGAQPVGSARLSVPSLPSTVSSLQLTNPSDQFYTAVLAKLDAQEQLVIKNHVTSNVSDAVQAAYAAACVQKKICEDNAWPGSDRAKKVVLWIERFKSVGDVVANVDPIHIGLPWAGVRLLLEAAVADSRQMTALMNGMDLALCIANRCQAYLECFRRLPISLTPNNLQEALIHLYAHVLRFLAGAIRTYSMGTAARKMQALWRVSELTTLEAECDKLGGRANIEASNCDRELRETMETGNQEHRFEDDDGYVTAVAFSSDGQIVLCVSLYGKVRLWNVQTGKQTFLLETLRETDAHRDAPIAVSPVKQVVVVAVHDGSLQLWDLRTGKQTHRVEGHSGQVTAIAYSPDGQMIASASNDATVRLWNAQTGEQIHRLAGHNTEVTAVTFSLDSPVVASVSRDRTVRVWSCQTGSQIQEIKDDILMNNEYAKLIFMPNGEAIVTMISPCNEARVWDVRTGQQNYRAQAMGEYV